MQIIPLAIGIFLVVLEYHMLCHFIIESNIPRNSKKGWILAFVLVSPIASIIYYFTEYRRS